MRKTTNAYTLTLFQRLYLLGAGCAEYFPLLHGSKQSLQDSISLPPRRAVANLITGESLTGSGIVLFDQWYSPRWAKWA